MRLPRRVWPAPELGRARRLRVLAVEDLPLVPLGLDEHIEVDTEAGRALSSTVRSAPARPQRHTRCLSYWRPPRGRGLREFCRLVPPPAGDPFARTVGIPNLRAVWAEMHWAAPRSPACGCARRQRPSSRGFALVRKTTTFRGTCTEHRSCRPSSKALDSTNSYSTATTSTCPASLRPCSIFGCPPHRSNSRLSNVCSALS